MFNRKSSDGLVDQAVATAEAAIEGTQHLVDQAGSMAHHGMDAVRDTTRLVNQSAHQAADKTLAYIRDEPVKAVLMTAAATVGLIAIVSLFNRSSRQH